MAPIATDIFPMILADCLADICFSLTDFDIDFEGLLIFARAVTLSLRMNLCENPDTRFDVLDLPLIFPSWWGIPGLLADSHSELVL